MKIGSLFDGSGGFPLAGAMCGFIPTWASEVEPYPIAVTKSRFPAMKHLGNVCKINGAEIKPVDIITFGSPCQDMSVAGKRAGLKHEDNGDEETTRSGLFMEAVRIIKEMRGATNGEYPRFAVWENVPGAFSSNKGEDFKIVLEELIKITEPNAVMPKVSKNGWAYADSFSGDGWSLAYRVLDAQFWGVPQRRRRVYLVADFRGQCAGDILFKREGLRGYFTESRTPWQGASANAQGSVGADDRARESITTYSEGFCTEHSAKSRGIGFEEETSPTLRAGVTPACVYSVENHPADSRVNLDNSGKVQTLTSRMGTGGGNVPMVMEPFCKSRRGKFKGDAETWKRAEVANTLNTFDQGETRANELVVYSLQGNGIDRADTAGCNGKGWRENVNYTLNTIDSPAVVYAMDRASFNQGENALYEPQIYEDGTNPTLVARGPSAVCLETFHLTTEDDKAQTLKARDYKDPLTVVLGEKPRYIVRRLTPTECARLQGFPDRWGDIEPKAEFTDEEYRFWLDVRNTHSSINGKKIKDYTEKQMLTWYNKLHSDSSEYKLWGNGIALPCALYVMQGIANTLEGEK